MNADGTLRRALCVALLLLACQVQPAISVRQHSIDGGGGRSNGGVYAVHGVLGEADGGRVLSGGTLQLRTGLVLRSGNDVIFRNGFE